MKEKRMEYIELLRVVCCFAVVGIHITMTQPNNYSIAELGTNNYTVLTCIYALIGWAVPVFFMISGNLLLHSSRITLEKVRGYVIRMAAVLLLFGSVFALMEQVFNEHTIRPVMVVKAVLLTLERKSWSHLWYLYVLIGIYLILIPLKKFVDHASPEELYFLTGTLIVGNFVIPTINIGGGRTDRYVYDLYTVCYLFFDGLYHREPSSCQWL